MNREPDEHESELTPTPAGLPLWHPATLIASWFGSGLLPVVPGTWGSAAALPFAWAIADFLHPLALGAAALPLFCVGWWAAEIAVSRSGDNDPGFIVVDEVVGQWLTLALVPPDVVLYAAGFVLFRITDVTKPGVIGWAERRMRGGLGVMLDDGLAAVHAAPLVWLLAWAIEAQR